MFESIIGHEKEKKTIENILKNNTFSHAYLFVGPSGIGKCLFARELAKVLLNTNNLDTCLDYKYVCKESDKKEFSVERIRKEVLDDIYIAPAMSDRKVYIIDDGETLNSSSQNALLKTLEEPPQNVHIIIISNSLNTFLPTILSRINVINFNGIESDKLKEYINKKFDIKLSDNIIDFIDGSIGMATNVIENNLLDKLSSVEKLYNLILKKDLSNALIIANDGILSDENSLKYLEFLFNKNKLYHIVKFVEHAYIRLKNNGNYDIVIDNMIIDIIDNL